MRNYVIAGGGSGAKVVEALVHLCSAGQGPDELAILLVDSDTNNGNLKRTSDTIESYNKMRQWQWCPIGNKPAVRPFRTDITLYKLDAQIGGAAVGLNGLGAHLNNTDRTLLPAMKLLYDQTELANPFRVGFKGRPNIGSLLLADHISKNLSDPDTEAGEFARQLLVDAGAASATGGWLPVTVIGSIFGGTGASLIPVAYDCIQKIFEADPRNMQFFARLKWARCMLLPYFRPTHCEDNVDPDIFLFNASVALQFYSHAPFAGTTYVVGSSDPARNMIDPQPGGADQCNPGYIEEVVTAVGALRFMGEAVTGVTQQALYVLPLQLDQHPERALDFGDVPISDVNRNALAYMLHLGAFFLRQGAENQAQHDKGLYTYLRLFDKGDDRTPSSLARVPWFSSYIYPWARHLKLSDLPMGSGASRCADILLKGGNENTPGAPYVGAFKDTALDFFARLVLWANGVFNKGDVKGISMNTKMTHFQSVHSTMCLKSGIRDKMEVPVDVPDNMLARICRIALAAMQLEQETKTYGRQHKDIEPFELWGGGDDVNKRKQLALALDEEQIRSTLNTHLRATMRNKVNAMVAGYRATQ